MGTECPWEQRDQRSKSSFAIDLLIVPIFHLSLLSVDNVISTHCCSLIYGMLTAFPDLSQSRQPIMEKSSVYSAGNILAIIVE